MNYTAFTMLLAVLSLTPSVFASGKIAVCPGGIASQKGSAPLLKVGKTWQLIGCGFTESTQDHGKKFIVSGFDLYTVDPKGVISSAIRTISELEHVLAYQEGESLVMDEMIYYRDEWVPAFRVVYSCSDRACAGASSKCVFKRPKLESKHTVSEIRKFIKLASAGTSLDEMDIDAIKDLAIDGDAQAKSFFLHPAKKLSVDGASAEAFSKGQDILKRLDRCN